MSERNGHDLVKQLRQRYLECGICTEVYDEDVHVPKLLPCLHTFCLKCISTIHKVNSLTCPVCNQMHNLNKGKLQSLPKDNTRRDLTDFLLKHKKSDLEKCAICGKNKHLSVKCETCVMRICSDCKHKHQRKYPMHIFVNGLLPVSSEIENNDVCDQTGHDRGRLRYFCKDLQCEKVLCATCVITEHKHHPVEDIDVLISDRKTSFQQLLQSVRQKHITVKDLENKSKKNILLLNDQAITCRKKLKDAYTEGVQKLRAKKEKAIQCLEMVLERNEKRLNTTNDKMASYLVNANECCNISEELLRNSTKTSFLTLERTVSEHLRNFLISEIDKLDVQGNCLYDEIEEISIEFQDLVNQLDKLEGTKQAAIIEESRLLQHASTASLRNIGRFLSKCLRLTLPFIILTILFIYLAWITPMHEFDHRKAQDLHFDIEVNNPYIFPCNTADNKTVSTRVNESGMTCRQYQHRSRQIFGQNGFGGTKEYRLDITVIIETKNTNNKIEKNSQFERRNINDIIFEFGITTKEDESSLYLYERKNNTWGITGYACKSGMGICLRTNEKQIFSENAIFTSRRNNSFIEAHFTINIQLQKRRCKIFSKDVLLHTFENVPNEFFVWPVYGIYEDKKYISITITSAGQLFDKSTLFPNVPLFISIDSTVFANRKLTLGTKKVLFNDFQRYVLVKPLHNYSCYETIMHIVEISFPEILNLPNNTVLLEMGFLLGIPRRETVFMDSITISVTNSFTYYTSFFGLKKSISYCVEDALYKFRECSQSGLLSGMRKLRFQINLNTLISGIQLSSFNEMDLDFAYYSQEPWLTMPRLYIKRRCELCEPGIMISIRGPNALEYLLS